MPYEMPLNIKYNENCEFKSSEVQCNISVNAQSTTCTLSADKTEYIIGDYCTFTVQITAESNYTVKTGTVALYKKQNNTDTLLIDNCKVDNKGQVIIKYQPTTTGDIKFYAKYIDNKFFKNSCSISDEENPTYLQIKVLKKNTTINFIDDDTTKYVNPNEPATLKVKVTTNDNKPLKYGRVTFLSYEEYDVSDIEDRPFKVIGNPVFLNSDGIATLQYIPKDVFGNFKHYETIKAIYNYKNDEYDTEWRFYEESHDFTTIYIAQEGIINIDFKDSTSTSLPLYDYKWHYAQEGERLSLLATINDDDNQVLFETGDEIHIVIQGTRVVNDNLIDIEPYEIIAEYEEQLSAFYIEDINSEINLSRGYYIIYAFFEGDKGKIEIEPNVIYDEYIKATDKSLIYYLQIEYEDITDDISITITTSETRISKGKEFPLNAQVNNLTLNQIDALNGQPCKYHIGNETVSGKFKKEGNTLKIEPDNSIKKYITGKYKVYIEVEKKVYNNIELKQSLYSNSVDIIVADQRDYTLEIDDETPYLKQINYTLKVDNIVDDFVTATIYNDNEEITVQNLDDTLNKYQGRLNNVPVGEHILKAVFSDDNRTIESSYEVIKSVINYKIIGSKEIIVDPYQLVSIQLLCTGGKFNIDRDDIVVKVDNKEVAINNIQTVGDNESLIITFNSGILSDGNHIVTLELKNNNNYLISEDVINFTGKYITPKYTVTLEEDNSYKITMNDHQQNIPIYVNFDNTKYCIAVTNKNGEAIVEYDEDYDEEEWRNFNTVQLYINPNTNYSNELYGDMPQTIEAPYDGLYFTFYNISTKEYTLRG